MVTYAKIILGNFKQYGTNRLTKQVYTNSLLNTYFTIVLIFFKIYLKSKVIKFYAL